MSDAATSSTYTSNVSSSLKQSILDTIINIAPTDCVFYNTIGKGKAKAKLEEWEEDTLQAAATNSQIEGLDADSSAITYPTRSSNYTQISYKVFKLSDTFERVDKVGRSSEIAYQTGRHMAMLKRDMEYDMLNTAASAQGNGTGTARASMGAKGFVTTNLYSFSNSQASTNLLTEDIFNDNAILAWAQGGEPSVVITSMVQKRKISSFNGNNKLTVTESGDSRKIINTVDVYEGEAGTVTIKPSRFLAADSTYYDWLFFIDPKMWDVLFLKPITTEKLARSGPSTKVMIDCEYTLRCKSQKANAAISNLYNV
jgi:hypothetical protein